MRIFFGRKPENGILLDTLLYEFLIKHDYSLPKATEELSLINDNNDYYTMNPMIFQYADLIDNTYIIQEDNNIIHIKHDEAILKKMDYMGLGEALVDDSRSYKDS